MLILASMSLAGAADEPCYGHSADNRVSGEQFWVEWDPEVLSGPDEAGVILEAAEHAAVTYRGLGWPVTTEPIVIHVREGGSGIAGLAQTSSCGSAQVPFISLFLGDWDATSAADVTAHEIGHAAQYGYMGSYVDSSEAWLWWMEGVATWLAPQADGLWTGWGQETEGYLTRPGLALHHWLDTQQDPEINPHMYGTGYVAESLAEFADDDAVRATWEWGGPFTGAPIFFADAVDGAGVDFAAYWAFHLATMPTTDLERGNLVGDVEIAQVASRMPGSGDSAGPGGLGVEIVRFPSSLGEKKQGLAVSFDGDPSVPWHVVLVRATGDQVIDYVPLDVTDGHGEGVLPAFYRIEVYLVASPHTIDQAPRPFSWSAELVDDPGESMAGTVTLGEAPDTGGGGCDHTRGVASATIVALSAVVSSSRARRRMPRPKAIVQ